MLRQTLNVQAARLGLFPVVDAVQGDSGRVLACRLTDFTIPAGSTARIYAVKPSGAQIYNVATVNGNIVEVELTTQMLAELGKTICQVEIENGDERVTSFDFAIQVAKSRVDGSAIESKDEFTTLESAIDNAESATQAANSAATSATEAAGDAVSAKEAAEKAAETASKAASTASSTAQEVQKKLEAGDFNANITVGSTKTGEPGTQASVTNSGTNMDVILNFTIPRGDSGTIENIDGETVSFTEANNNNKIASGEMLTTLFGKISRLFTRVGTAESNVSNLQSTTGGLNADINALETRTSNLETKANQLETKTNQLPIANGGTGATTAAGARNNLGLGNTTGALPIANGGTGATTAAKARDNLGITPANIGALPVGYRSNSVWNGSLNAYINSNGHWLPGDTAQQLGTSGVRWNYVCLAHNPDVSSDRRLKADIQSDMEKYVDMLERLRPCTYTIRADGDGVKHAGYIAQEVEEALKAAGLSAEDFGGFVYHKEEDNYALRYEEFIPVLHAAIIVLTARVRELESRL